MAADVKRISIIYEAGHPAKKYWVIYENGLMEPDKTAMLRSIFKLGTTGVREIMIPSTNVISISSETTQKDALEKFKKYQFSRFPVYEGSLDNVIGMLHLKDLFVAFLHNEDRAIKNIVRPILFIPESIKVNQLLKEFKHSRLKLNQILFLLSILRSFLVKQLRNFLL